MQSAAAIREAARRLEDAATVFHLKSRRAQDEYSELGARWSDARARQFAAKHLDPQRELIEQGARLCRMHGEHIDAAQAAADEAENEIAGFFAAQSAYESAVESSQSAAAAAEDQAARATADSSRALAALQALAASIAAATADPGW